MFEEFGINAGFVEELHARYQQSPQSVEEKWRGLFLGARSKRNRKRNERQRRVRVFERREQRQPTEPCKMGRAAKSKCSRPRRFKGAFISC